MAVFEHALFMLLLLVGIFSSRPPQRQWTLGLLGVGLFLSLLPPSPRFTIPWEFILHLTIPLLFWQNARHWLHARWRIRTRELLLWLGTIALLGGILYATGFFTIGAALLFGLITASMLWRSVESEHESHQISQIGPLTLIFLLTEIAPAVETPRQYLGGLFSGAAVGIAIGMLGVYISPRLLPVGRGWLGLILVYLAYFSGNLIDASSVAAALLSLTIYAEFGLRKALADEKTLLPNPMDHWAVFLLALSLFVFLGWQTHQQLTASLVVEALLGLLVGLLVGWLGWRLRLPGFSTITTAGVVGLRSGLFFFAALLLWPRHILGDILPLLGAVGLAVFVIGLSATLLSATSSFQES